MTLYTCIFASKRSYGIQSKAVKSFTYVDPLVLHLYTYFGLGPASSILPDTERLFDSKEAVKLFDNLTRN